MVGRLIEEVRRREKVIRIFPNMDSAWGRAIAESDVERIFSFWTEDVVLYPGSEPAVRGIDAVREYVRRNRQERGLRPRVTPLEIVASESVILATSLARTNGLTATDE